MVCSRHFISGKPASLYDVTNPDWLPTQHLDHQKIPCSKTAKDRWMRRKARREAAIVQDTCMPFTSSSTPESAVEPLQLPAEKATQTELTTHVNANLQEHWSNCYNTIKDLTVKLADTFSEDSFQNDDHVKFYTGLPNMKVLKAVFNHVVKSVPISTTNLTKLTPFQEFVTTLVKLRLNCHVQDLAYRVKVSPCSHNFKSVTEMVKSNG